LCPQVGKSTSVDIPPAILREFVDPGKLGVIVKDPSGKEVPSKLSICT